MIRFFKILPLLLFIFIIGFNSSAQTRRIRSCATEQYMQRQIVKDPSILQRMDAIEKHIQNYVNNPTNQNSKNAIITIPVVFHVVYNNSTQNISDLQLQSQIDVLNEDFAALNSDISNVPSAFQSLIGNSQIQFCLASKDPNGNPTTGILRVSTATTSFSSNNAIKFSAQGGSNAWPATDYLNFWVGNLSGGLLGYAQFPGGSASTDGVVCLYTSIGKPPYNNFGGVYNLGRTATHEVGHWLNLRHIWGDSSCGNDFVADTPTQQTSNGGCPSFPHVTCGNGPNGDMFMNYMDYVYDACMVMFSAGQSVRMNALFAGGGARASLLVSNGCDSSIPCTNSPVGGVITGASNFEAGPGGGTYVLSGYTGNIQWQYSIISGGPYTDFIGANSNSVDLISSSPGTYYLRAALNANGCAEAFSNEFYLTVDARTGDNINKPIIVNSQSYNYVDSTVSTSGFTNQNGSQIDGQSSADVYFKIITQPCSDRLDINTCPSLFDTYIHLLDVAGNLIVSNDDNGPFCSGTGVPGSISTPVQPNTAYYIVVEGWDISTGVFTIDINERDDNPLALTTIKHNISCNGSMDGLVTVNVIGGESPYSYIWNVFPTQSSNTLNNLNPGTYTVLVADNIGCSNSATAVISSPAMLISNNTIVHPTGNGSSDGSIDLTILGGNPPYQYLWSNGNTTANLAGLTEGVYYCYIADANGCAILVSESLIGNGNFGSSNSKLSNNNFNTMIIYPNPAVNEIRIEMISAFTEEVELKITDLNRSVIHSKFMDVIKGTNSIKVDLSEYSSGVYFISINSRNLNEFKKLIVQ